MVRAAFLALAVALSPVALTACAPLQVQTAAPTYEQSLGTAYVTLAEVTKLATRAVQTDRMSIEQAKAIRDFLTSARTTLHQLSFAPDAGTLEQVQRMLGDIERRLESMQ